MYIGATPQIGNYQIADALSASATATYALTVSSVAVYPETSFHVICSLNGIIQKPGSSFSISGSNIVFSSALTSSDSIDFILLLGNTLDVGSVSDGTITAAKVANDLISGKTALATAPADTDEFLVSDAGTLKRIDYSLIKSDMVKIASGNLTGAGTISIDGYFSSTYLNYRIIFDSILTDTDDSDLNIRVNTSSSADSSSNYYYASARTYLNSGANAVDSTKSGWGQDKWLFDDGLEDDNKPAVLDLMIYNPLSTSITKVMMASYWNLFSNGAQYNNHRIGMNWNATTALTGITIYLSSGNFETSSDTSKNNWTLYGYKN
jgi:hypothetical protein